jgi:hypothetical protein
VIGMPLRFLVYYLEVRVVRAMKTSTKKINKSRAPVTRQ